MAEHMFARSHYQYDSNSRETATWRDEDGSKGDLFRFNAASQLTDASCKADWVWTGQVHNSPLNVGYQYPSSTGKA